MPTAIVAGGQHGVSEARERSGDRPQRREGHSDMTSATAPHLPSPTKGLTQALPFGARVSSVSKSSLQYSTSRSWPAKTDRTTAS